MPPTTTMRVRVLGCSGAIAQGCRTTAFLLDDDTLIDAGTGVGDLSLEEMLRIDHVLLSPAAADRLETCGIDAETRSREKPSDHVPIWVTLDA